MSYDFEAALRREQAMKENTIKLQSVGDVPAVRVDQLQVGNCLMWNFGYVYEVVAIRQVTPQFLEIDEKPTAETVQRHRIREPQVTTRRMKKSRLVALAPSKTLRDKNPQVTEVLNRLREAGVKVMED